MSFKCKCNKKKESEKYTKRCKLHNKPILCKCVWKQINRSGQKKRVYEKCLCGKIIKPKEKIKKSVMVAILFIIFTII